MENQILRMWCVTTSTSFFRPGAEIGPFTGPRRCCRWPTFCPLNAGSLKGYISAELKTIVCQRFLVYQVGFESFL